MARPYNYVDIIMNDQLIVEMEKAAHEVKKWPKKTVNIFHHNDADGLSSGAILRRSFEREGFEIRSTCLEKPYPAVLKKIYEHEGSIIIFADFAGRIAPLLSELNGTKNLTLILDHHAAIPSTNPKVYNLDPIPTWLLTDCIGCLLPINANCAHIS